MVRSRAPLNTFSGSCSVVCGVVSPLASALGFALAAAKTTGDRAARLSAGTLAARSRTQIPISHLPSIDAPPRCPSIRNDSTTPQGLEGRLAAEDDADD